MRQRNEQCLDPSSLCKFFNRPKTKSESTLGLRGFCGKQQCLQCGTLRMQKKTLIRLFYEINFRSIFFHNPILEPDRHIRSAAASSRRSIDLARESCIESFLFNLHKVPMFEAFPDGVLEVKVQLLALWWAGSVLEDELHLVLLDNSDVIEQKFMAT